MADDFKTVSPTLGTTLYTGAGLYPFRPGEVASVPAYPRRPGSSQPQ
jgi:hypothetical protein